jgi:hypothetical protein
MNPEVDVLIDQAARYFAEAIAAGDFEKAEQFAWIGFGLASFACEVSA